MRKLFYLTVLLLLIFEISNIYFIMPFPGSQEMDCVKIAYSLYHSRWFIRIALVLVTLFTIRNTFRESKKWVPITYVILVGVVIYAVNFHFSADKMFQNPGKLIFKNAESNNVPLERVVIGVKLNGKTKAYPIIFLAYHHQIVDEIGGTKVIVTYCDVCRSGRVFEPRVKGNIEEFRLVGMRHSNALFEDFTTKSWWQQESGTAILGELKGQQLPEVVCYQMSLSKWLELNPDSEIMQPDLASIAHYGDGSYEKGEDKGTLTRTSKQEWADKSWVVGVELNKTSKAYSWKSMKTEKIINDNLAGTSIIVALSTDNNSFIVLENPTKKRAQLQNDTIIIGDQQFDFSGKGINTSNKLKVIQAYQEFWHSWYKFHPDTQKY